MNLVNKINDYLKWATVLKELLKISPTIQGGVSTSALHMRGGREPKAWSYPSNPARAAWCDSLPWPWRDSLYRIHPLVTVILDDTLIPIEWRKGFVHWVTQHANVLEHMLATVGTWDATPRSAQEAIAIFADVVMPGIDNNILIYEHNEARKK